MRIDRLELERCPHCNVFKPTLKKVEAAFTVNDYNDKAEWAMFLCSGCHNITMARFIGAQESSDESPADYWPCTQEAHKDLPPKVKQYLQKAINTVHEPEASLVMSAAAVDVMMREIGCDGHSLDAKIKKAETDGKITKEMARWAHLARLDANAQRHVDDTLPPATARDAQEGIDLVEAFGHFLFVVPKMVAAGLKGHPVDKTKNL